MSFVSFEYILLLLACVIMFYVLPKKVRFISVFIGNIVFCYSFGFTNFVIVYGSILITYLAAVVLSKIIKYRKSLCLIYVAIMIFMLFNFKYQIFGVGIVPMAISFYTLTCIGYVIDVYRGKYKAEINVFKLAAVFNFFPIMVQGPICRYDEVSSDFVMVKFDFEKFTSGVKRIVYGVFKKLVIAERLGIAFENLSKMNDDGTAIFLNIFVYALYLFTDFSAGIDIAIGSGKLFGIKLPENFNKPFFATSISDYWRRWHMSLGLWLRDYVFYPVSFSKVVVSANKVIRGKFGNAAARKFPVYIATVVVWFVTGIWHGATANFILWGMLNCVVVIISLELAPLYKKFNKRFKFTEGRVYGVFRCVRTFMLMGVLRMLDYNTVGGYFKSLWLMISDFHISKIFDMSLGIATADVVLVLVCMFSLFVISLIKKDRKRGIIASYAMIAIMIFATVIFGMYGIGYEGKEFIYIKY